MLTGFNADLLARTIDYVVEHIPYYRELRAARLLPERPELTDFPIVSKAEISTDFEKFINLTRFPDYILTSGGSSGSGPSINIKNTEEYLALFHYVGGGDPFDPPSVEQLDGFTLDILFNSNGYSWRHPPGWPILTVILEREFHAELVQSLLSNGLVVGGRRVQPNRVQAQNGPLRTLTGYFEAVGFDASSHNIESITVYGGHITAAWRRRLVEKWGVSSLTSLYGLSEFAGAGARECSECGSYHFWASWPEFLDHRTGEPVDDGDARLVLTSLVPFAQAQPRIRFDTGDIVSVKGRCEATGRTGFRFRGRRDSSLFNPADPSNVMLSEIDVLEVVDDQVEVNRRAHSSELQIWSNGSLPRPSFPMGFPRFKVSPEGPSNPGTPIIRIEATFSPSEAPGKAKALGEQICEQLITRLQEMGGESSAMDLVRLEILGPGDLDISVKSAA